MANIIAVIWDFDKTLVDGYMQDPMFEEYGIDSKQFWAEVNSTLDQYEKQHLRVNKDVFYLNYFIKYAKEGIFKGLNNQRLNGFGKTQQFYPGVPEFLKETKELLKGEDKYAELGIQVEHYIISTGFAEVIRGSQLMPYLDGVWGCELLDGTADDGSSVISEVVYTIDNTTKTRAVFEINKGIGKLDGIDVNSKIPKELRRVRMENMIYIADGPSDIPAFSVIKQNGGATFAIYPKGDVRAMQQVDQMRADGRVDMYAEADYSPNTTANMWITQKIREMAERMLKAEKDRVAAAASPSPRHIT
ncbi:MAG: haloacid dehalogenase-like hydrolase [Firmicutes bacterium]|nr:haloacid dehalogenase-like hydrolase [Bacillota bacterium]